MQKVALVDASYTTPSRHAVAGPMLQADAERVKSQIDTKRLPVQKFGSTLVSDVATDGNRRPNNNLINISAELAELVKAEDCTGKTKDKEFIAKFVTDYVYSLPNPFSVVQVLMDNATRASWPIIEREFFYGFASFLKALDAIAQTLTSQEVIQYVRSNRTQRATPESRTLHELFTEAKEIATDTDLQPQVALCQDVLKPIVMLLRLADSDRPSASKIQYHKFEVQETLKALKKPEPEPWAAGEYDWDDMLQEIIAIHRYRWDYGYTIVQGTGYLLDPEFVDMDQHLDAATMESFTRFVAKTYPKPKPFEPGSTPTELEKQVYEEGCRAAVANRSAAEIQLLEYKMKRGVFSRETVWETAKHVSAADF
ncbi:hypothetical protein CYMTET_11784 [Cymbomonas tetramitiformis]|uniref:Uncharacterized protein n=1 Tax=Cymbomonas tetramitiformis TaxID=36881 RepID=A0AAE0GN06_9CHLO|nr:hypothetical protein CYMTET_11784 [Cymbomonas tetramitiformis]